MKTLYDRILVFERYDRVNWGRISNWFLSNTWTDDCSENTIQMIGGVYDEIRSGITRIVYFRLPPL
jgi:hypothetical protein